MMSNGEHMPTTTPIVFDDKVPEWLAAVVSVTQADEDLQYNRRLVSWNTNNQAWLVNAQREFELGLDMSTPPAIPTKEVFGVRGGVLAQYTWQDPTLAPPTFAPVRPSPSAPLTTSAPARDATSDAILRAILQTVLAIKNKVGA